MKNLLILLNAIMLAAIVYLLFKVHKLSECEQSCRQPAPAVSASGIVFLNTDSLLEAYPYYDALKKKLESRQDSLEKMISGRTKSIETSIKNYQDKAGNLTPEQRQAEEEKLYLKQQELVEYRKSLMESLSESENAMMDSLQHDLVKILKKFNKDKNYQFILGFQKGSGILLANDSLDITKEIISVINNSK